MAHLEEPSAWSPTRWPRSRSCPPSQPPMTRGKQSSTSTRSLTKPPERGARPQRSPRFRSPRLPHGRRPTRSPGGSSVRRIPDLNPHAKAGQATLFQTWRFHAFFTTSTLDTVIADKTHRGHAIIEQVHADMENSALAQLPSGIFNANAAWLVLAVMAFNLTRAAATLGGTTMAKATTATSRDDLTTCPHRARRRISGTPPTAMSQHQSRPDTRSTVQTAHAPLTELIGGSRLTSDDAGCHAQTSRSPRISSPNRYILSAFPTSFGTPLEFPGCAV